MSCRWLRGIAVVRCGGRIGIGRGRCGVCLGRFVGGGVGVRLLLGWFVGGLVLCGVVLHEAFAVGGGFGEGGVYGRCAY